MPSTTEKLIKQINHLIDYAFKMRDGDVSASAATSEDYRETSKFKSRIARQLRLAELYQQGIKDLANEQKFNQLEKKHLHLYAKGILKVEVHDK